MKTFLLTSKLSFSSPAFTWFNLIPGSHRQSCNSDDQWQPAEGVVAVSGRQSWGPWALSQLFHKHLSPPQQSQQSPHAESSPPPLALLPSQSGIREQAAVRPKHWQQQNPATSNSGFTNSQQDSGASSSNIRENPAARSKNRDGKPWGPGFCRDLTGELEA